MSEIDSENRDDQILQDRFGRLDEELKHEQGPAPKVENQIKGSYGGTRGMFNFMDLVYRLFSDLGTSILRLFESTDKKK